MSHHEHPQQQEHREALARIIESFRTAMLVTDSGADGLVSRPMSPLGDEFDGTLWFATERDNTCVAQVKANPRVHVSFADEGRNDYVSVSGRATQVDDRAKVEELWNPALSAFFEGEDDPKLTLIRVDVDTAEYWDGPGTLLGKLAFFAKVAAGGDHGSMTDNARVDMRHD